MGIMIAGIVVVGIYSFFLIRRGLRFWLKRDSGIFLNIVNLVMAAVVIFCCADIWSISAVIVLHIIAVALLIDIAALLAGKKPDIFGR